MSGAGGSEREPPRQDPEALRGAPRMQRGRPDELDPARREAGHEPGDAPARGVAWAAAGFFIGLLASVALVWVALEAMRARHDAQPVTATRERAIVPPEPRLAVARERFAAEIDGAAPATLLSYEWTDRDAGLARVPVEEAMRLLAEHGWPDAFDPEDVVPPRATIRQRTAPRPTGDLLADPAPGDPPVRERQP